MSAQKEGRIVGGGVIEASKIALGLGLGGPESLKEPEGGDGRPLDTPAQARARAEGKPAPPDPPGFERTRIKGGRDAWEFFGRPADVNAAPPGTPDGTPLPPEYIPREEEDRIRERRGETPQRTNWERIDREQRGRELARKLNDLRDRMERLLRKEAGADK